MQTRITDLLKIEFPLIQGGLWGLAYAELCGPVSEAGAMGQLTAGMHRSPESLAEEIERVRAITQKPFGVNFPMHARDQREYVETAIAGGCSMVTLTGGDPTQYIDQVAGRVSTLVLTSSVRQSVKAEAAGASAVIVVGQEGGGNIGHGDSGTISVVPQVVDAVHIPVLASGGIADGRGFLAGLALGTEGIEMGTRFVAVRECRAVEEYKEAIVEVGDIGTAVVLIKEKARVRVLAEDAERMKEFSVKEDAESKTEKDRYQPRGAGQSAGLIKDIPTVQELIERLRREVEEGYARLGRILQ